VRLSIYRALSDPPQVIETTWGDFVASIRVHALIEEKGAAYLFSPAVFPPGTPRKSQYVDCVSFGVMDFDHLTHEHATALIAHLSTLPFRWVLYTTFSHGWVSDGIKSPNPPGTVESAFRVLVPFLSPVPGIEWDKFYPRFAALFSLPGIGVVRDKACSDSNRIYYIPSAPPDRSHLVQFYEHAADTLPTFDPAPLRLAMTVAAAITGVPVSSKPRTTGGGFAGVTRPALEALAKRLKRKKAPTGDAILKVLDGVPWAQHGERDKVLYQMAGDIAAEFPDADMREVSEFFTLSLTAMDDSEYTRDLVIDKLLRKQSEQAQAKELAAEAESSERALRIRAAFKELAIERDEPYTEAELAMFAASYGIGEPEFRRRWVLLCGGAYYFFVNGAYIGPIVGVDATLAAHRYLAPAPLELETRDVYGRATRKAIDAIALDYGTQVRFSYADLNADTAVFDAPASTLIEAPAPLRPLSAKYDETVNEWLAVLAGDRVGVVLDWLSYVTDLSRPCAALYLQGAVGAGKTLLAVGLADLWSEYGPSTLVQAFANFNEGIMRCPLVLADESIPRDFRGNAKTAELREFIQQRSRPLTRKNIRDSVLNGATRLIITSNNKNLLQTNEALTPHDIKAIADRIIHIPVPDSATAWMEARPNIATRWKETKAIARHALWVVENRAKNPDPPRFLVRLENDGLSAEIAFNSAMGSAVSHWLVSFLENFHRLLQGKSVHSSAFGIGVNVTCDALMVSTTAITDNWGVFKTNVKEDRATIRAVGMALGSIAARRTEYGFPNGTRRTVHVVELKNLAVWADEIGVKLPELLSNAKKLHVFLQGVKERAN